MTIPQIITVRLPLVNAYLLRGDRWIVVDSGAPGDAPAILRAAAAYGIAPVDITLILLTHGHVDHFGGAAALRELSGAPVAVHQDDLSNLRSGHNPHLFSTGLEARLLRPFLPWSAPPLEPDIVFSQRFDLRPYGLAATTIHTPGHSAGSVALPLPDGSLIAGDLLRGGFMGGRIAPGLPNPPFYVDRPAELRASISRVLDLPIHTLYLGHGGPLAADAARKRLAAGAFALAALRDNDSH